jgi:Holliday junction resolvase-like predicted endonuclease
MDSRNQGLAAEYLVAADLCKQGYTAVLAAAGGRYDVLADVNGRLLRIQVKSTAKQTMDSGHRNPTYKFRFANNNFDKRINSLEVDVVALVAIDSSLIAYLPAKECGARTMKLTPAGVELNAWNKRGKFIDQLPFSRVLEELTI